MKSEKLLLSRQTTSRCAATADRPNSLSTTVLSLANALVNDYDIVDLLDVLATTCVDLGLADTAGLLLADVDGALRVLACSDEQSRLLELLEIQNDDGPSLECLRTGLTVSARADGTGASRWPEFVAAARAAGFEAVHALPMRLREQKIGALNLFLVELFLVENRPLNADDRATAQALADVATIGIVQQRVTQDKALLAHHLQATLIERLVIERAKGVLAEWGLAIADTFARLRDYARANRLTITEAAQRIAEGDLDPHEVLEHPK